MRAFQAGRSSYVRGNVAGILIERDAGDFSARINTLAKHQVQRGAWDERVEIGHDAVLPNEGAAVEADVARLADYPTVVVNAECEAREISRQRT